MDKPGASLVFKAKSLFFNKGAGRQKTMAPLLLRFIQGILSVG
jgi:hypothetical protein